MRAGLETGQGVRRCEDSKEKDYFPLGLVPRGGVIGRLPPPNVVYGFFFSAGRKIYKVRQSNI